MLYQVISYMCIPFRWGHDNTIVTMKTRLMFICLQYLMAYD